jgi:hypothetical protein
MYKFIIIIKIYFRIKLFLRKVFHINKFFCYYKKKNISIIEKYFLKIIIIIII